MSNEPEETEEPHEFIEVHLKIPKPEAPKVIIPKQEPHHIHITNITTVHPPAEKTKTGVPEMDREPKPEPEGDMKSSGFSTAKKVAKFGSILEKDAVGATQDFKRRGITIKDSRAS